MRRVRDVENGGFPAAFEEPNKRLSGPRFAILDSIVVQGSHPDCLRALLGTSTTLVLGARIQVRVSGKNKKQKKKKRREIEMAIHRPGFTGCLQTGYKSFAIWIVT